MSQAAPERDSPLLPVGEQRLDLNVIDYDDIKNLSVSNASAVHSTYALHRSIVARINDIKFHLKKKSRIAPAIAEKADNHVFHLKKLVSQLDIYYSNNQGTERAGLYKKTSREFRQLGSKKEHLTTIFKKYLKPTGRGLSKTEVKLMEDLKNKGKAARLGEMKWRLQVEICEAQEKGWFVIFETLTVSPRFYGYVFEKGSMAFNQYIRSVERDIGKQIYGTIVEAEASRKAGIRFHKYFAVIERGSKNGRLHIHVVHLCQDIPNRCKGDPNKGRPGVNRQLNHWQFWKYGNDMPIAVRFQGVDAYARLGWSWPLKQKNGVLTKVPGKPPIALARYVAKYVSKEYARGTGKEGFRCRMTRKFGTGQLVKMLQTLPIKAVAAAATLQDRTILSRNRMRPPPMALLRKTATMILFQSLNSRTVSTIVQELRQRPPIIAQFRLMMKPTTNPNTRNITYTRIQMLKNMDVCEVLADAWEKTTASKISQQRTTALSGAVYV